MCRLQKVAVPVPIPLTNRAKAPNNHNRTNPHQIANLDRALNPKVLRAVNLHHKIQVTDQDLVLCVRDLVHLLY